MSFPFGPRRITVKKLVASVWASPERPLIHFSTSSFVESDG
jgi:hypothetical protein